MRKSGKEPSVRRTAEALRRGASTLNLKGTHSLHRFQGLNMCASCPLLQGESRSVTSIPWALAQHLPPHHSGPAPPWGGTGGGSWVVSFLLVYRLVSGGRGTDRHTERKRESESGNREEEKEAEAGCSNVQGCPERKDGGTSCVSLRLPVSHMH